MKNTVFSTRPQTSKSRSKLECDWGATFPWVNTVVCFPRFFSERKRFRRHGRHCTRFFHTFSLGSSLNALTDSKNVARLILRLHQLFQRPPSPQCEKVFGPMTK